LALVQADFNWANSARQAALTLANKYRSTNGMVRFEGHWGFQYYMQQQGGSPLNNTATRINQDDRIIVPGSSKSAVHPDLVDLAEKAVFRSSPWLSTMSLTTGAGFYSDMFGPLPFALGVDEPDAYYVLAPRKPFDVSSEVTPSQLSDAEIARELEPYEARISAHPADADPRIDLALFLVSHGRLVEAEQQLRDAIRLAPNNAQAHEHLALLADQSKRTEDAIAHYREALRSNPALPAALNNLAWILATHPNPKLRDGPAAVDLARRACTLSGNANPMYFGTLAAAYAEAGLFSEAIAAAEHARDLAAQTGRTELAKKNAELLELYRKHQPVRQE
jgi:cytochrome c-type biogenesis protein CcmH/NrfG